MDGAVLTARFGADRTVRSTLLAAASLCESGLRSGEPDTTPRAPTRLPRRDCGAGENVWVRCHVCSRRRLAIWAWNATGELLGGLDPAVPNALPARDESTSRELPANTTVLELDALPPFLEVLLADRERGRAAQLGTRRAKMFAAGRVALKLTTAASDLPLAELDTLADDGKLARSPVTGPSSVSIAHDQRLAVAATSTRGRLGIDVEAATPRLEKGYHLYASARELTAAKGFSQGLYRGLARIWTTKEAVTKASGLALGEVFGRCQIARLGRSSSTAVLDGLTVLATHTEIDDHVLTLAALP